MSESENPSDSLRDSLITELARRLKDENRREQIPDYVLFRMSNIFEEKPKEAEETEETEISILEIARAGALPEERLLELLREEWGRTKEYLNELEEAIEEINARESVPEPTESQSV